MTLIKSNGYNVIIGDNSLDSLSNFLEIKKYTSYFILSDPNIIKLCLPHLLIACPKLITAQIIKIKRGEKSKSLKFSTLIWQTLIDKNADKNTLLINFGGGVISDLGGFAAATFKRGIDFINIPTTLLAMADASLGGKTGINFNEFKNIIGTINQPKGVFINTKFLKTLSQRQLKNGLAEIYKIALVNSHTFWNELSSFSEKTSYINLITKSIQIKNKIILKDPFDKGIRKSLNFGHTIGHAIESEFLNSEAPMLHGEAVLIGLLIESKISYQKQLISKPMLLEIYSVLTSHFKPRSISEIPISSIINRIKNDKKASKNILLFSLINGIGSFKIDVIVSVTEIQKAITDHNNLIK